MAKKNRALSPELNYTIRALRVEGLSERAIYEQLREHIAITAPIPSYRDVRATLASAGLRYRRQAEAARKGGRMPDDLSSDQHPIQNPHYTDRLSRLHAVDRRPDAKDDLDRAYTLGFLARSGIDPDQISDTSLRESIVSIYEGTGS
ncbi:MAG: hypothetical protein WBF81_06020 [Thermoplasmata archaeon]